MMCIGLSDTRMASATLFSLIVAASLCCASVFACGSGSSNSTVANNVPSTAPAVVYVRCNVAGQVNCISPSCDAISGAVQLPTGTTFTSAENCKKYELWYLCAPPGGEIPLFACVKDITGCPVTVQNNPYNIVTYPTQAACTAALPTGYVSCLSFGVFSCALNKPGCGADRTQVSTTTFSSSSSCAASFQGYVRCINTDTQDFQCPFGAPVSASCASNRFIEPVGTSFITPALCSAYIGNIRCYIPGLNTYTCTTDLKPCPGGSNLVSNSLTPTACSTYTPATHARCANAGGTAVTCRPAEFVNWKNDNTVSTAVSIYSPLSGACMTGEFLVPSTSFTSFTSCNTYSAKVVCYTFSTKALACVDDFVCVGSDKKPVTASSSTCPTFTPTSHNRCIDKVALNNPICRPLEAGCSSTEIPNPLRPFATLDFCNAYAITNNRWVRCKNPAATQPYCIFQVCNDGDTLLTDLDGTYTSQISCLNALFVSLICYTANQSPDVNGRFYTITATPDYVSTTTCQTGMRYATYYWSSAASPDITNIVAGLPPLLVQNYRCKASPTNLFQPVCRPYANCASQGETTLQNPVAPYTSLQTCNAALYWGKVCYQADGQGYKLIIGYDDNNINGCDETTQLTLTANWLTAPAPTLSTAAGNYYSGILPITHYRCKTIGGLPACRPYDCSTAATARGETALQQPTPAYTTLNACLLELYWGVICYQPIKIGALAPTGAGVFKSFTLSVSYDHQFLPGCDPSQQYKISATWTKTPTPSLTTANSGYTAIAVVPHILCGDTITANQDCRPVFTGAATSVAAAGCPLVTNEVKYGAGPFASYNDCPLLATLPHYRCKGADGLPVCRAYACTPSGETLLQQPTPAYTTLNACLLELYWGTICYNPIEIPYPVPTRCVGPKFASFTQSVSYDHEFLDFCDSSSQYRISSTWTKTPGKTQVIAGSGYTEGALIQHIYCMDADGNQDCRPIFTGSSSTVESNGCPWKQGEVKTAGPFNSYSACPPLVGAACR